jgi:hypothetical protein
MYIKFNSITEFNTWHADVMNRFGIPNDLGTTEYTQPIVHPTNGTVAANVDERIDLNQYDTLTSEQVFELGYLERPSVDWL